MIIVIHSSTSWSYGACFDEIMYACPTYKCTVHNARMPPKYFNELTSQVVYILKNAISISHD